MNLAAREITERTAFRRSVEKERAA